MSRGSRRPAHVRPPARAVAAGGALLLALGLSSAATAAPGPDDPPPATKSTEGHQRITDDPDAAAKALEHAPYQQRERAASERRSYFVELRGSGLAGVFDRARSNGASAAGAKERSRQARADLADRTQTVRRAARGLDAGSEHLYDTRNAIPATVIRTTQATADRLAERKDVKSVRPIVPKQLSNASSVEFTRALAQWQATGFLGSGVSVGVIDTGVDYTHADFGGEGTTEAFEEARTSDEFAGTDKVPGGYDFVGDDYDGSNLPLPDANPLDCEGHGTHVAGSAAGLGVNADGSTFTGDYTALTSEDVRGMKIGPGTAPEADIYALRVFGCAGSTDVVAAALDWALDPNGDLDFSDRLDVVNLSLGSLYGSEDDPENAMVDALAGHGVLSVFAAGNEGDLTLVGGSSGNALSALTVANSISDRLPYDGITVDAPADVAGTHPGQYSQSYTGTDPISGAVVRLGDGDEGCDPYTPAEAAAVSGKVVWLHWPEAFECGSVVRADHAAAAGAIGVVMDSEVDVFSAGLSGNAAIPMFQFTRSATEAVTEALDAGTLEVTFDFQKGAAVTDVPGTGDTLNPGSSRVAHGSRTTVKPDVAAPGTQIMSAAVGGGSAGATSTGTSMAAPHVAGIAATVREAHPDWSPEQVKAAVMNTAVHDVSSTEGGAGPMFAPGRVGSGRVDAAYAASNEMLLHSLDRSGEVSASFGVIEAPIDGPTITRSRTVRVQNTGDAATDVTLSYAQATHQPGVSYAISPTSLSVPAGGTADATLTVTVDPAGLGREIDPTMAEEYDGEVPRQFVTTASGRLLADTGDGEPLRLPVSTAAKPVSTTTAAFTPDAEDPDSGTVTQQGTGIDQGGYTSLLNVFELGGTSARKPDCSDVVLDGCTLGAADASGDLRYVGATSDYPQYPSDGQAWAAFGVSTWSTWTAPGTATTPYVEIWTESPTSGPPDYELYAAPYLYFGIEWDYYAAILVHVPSDTVVHDLPLNLLEGDVDTNLFDSDTLVLATPLAALYAAAGAPASSLDDLSYRVGTYSGYGYGIESPIDLVPANGSTIPFDPRDPGVFADDGLLQYDDAGDYPVTRSAGLEPARILVAHQHGATGARAEVLRWRAEGDDRTPPRLVSATGSGEVAAVDGTGTVEYAWAFEDVGTPEEPASGVASYDVRQRVGDGEWTEPAGWQGIADTSLSAEFPAGTTVCFEVRARDNDGNVSDWAGEHCSTVTTGGQPPADTTPPLVTQASTPGPIAPTPKGTAIFSYAATDTGSGVASYDVEFRRAAPGKAFGPWQSREGWSQRADASVSLAYNQGRNICFRVRARDRAGNVGAWSAEACVTAPYDDFALKAKKGKVKRIKANTAMLRTLTRLRSSGARIVQPRQRARTITMTGRCRPQGGAVEVHLGSRKVGNLNLRCQQASMVTKTFDLGQERTGKLRITNRSKRPSDIDWVALGR